MLLVKIRRELAPAPCFITLPFLAKTCIAPQQAYSTWRSCRRGVCGPKSECGAVPGQRLRHGGVPGWRGGSVGNGWLLIATEGPLSCLAVGGCLYFRLLLYGHSVPFAGTHPTRPTHPPGTHVHIQVMIFSCFPIHSATPQRWWDVNIGVMFFNLRHTAMEGVLLEWLGMIEAITDDLLNQPQTKDYVAKDSKADFKNDQQVRGSCGGLPGRDKLGGARYCP